MLLDRLEGFLSTCIKETVVNSTDNWINQNDKKEWHAIFSVVSRDISKSRELAKRADNCVLLKSVRNMPLPWVSKF